MGSNIQSVADISAYVMRADGREDPEEWKALKTLAENQGFAWDEFKKAYSALLKYSTLQTHSGTLWAAYLANYAPTGNILAARGG